MFCSFHLFAPQKNISTCMIFKTTLAKQSYISARTSQPLKKDPKSITLAASLEFHPCSIFSSYFMTPKRPAVFHVLFFPQQKKTTTAHPVPRSPRFRDTVKGTELWRSFGRFPMTHPTSGGTENNLRFFGL